jgi:hypothetical protein
MGFLLPLFDTPVINRRILRVFVDLAIISFAYYVAFLLRFEALRPGALTLTIFLWS